MKYLALAAALAGAAGVATSAPQDDPALRSSGWELRVFVLDKATLKTVDLTDWTAELVIEPRGGKEQKVALMKSAPEPKVERKAETPPKEIVCGQVKNMDPYYVEVVVVHPGWMEKDGKRHASAEDGYVHSHGGFYFKAALPKSWWMGDAKQGALAFDADVHFTYGNEKKSVKGFSYPFGLYKDALQKVMDEDLKQAREYAKANDAAKWKEVAERIMSKTHALPELAFKKDEDRQEFERGKRECMTACEVLRGAATADQAMKAIDQCADKCDDYQDEAQDAEGVNWEFKGHEPKHPRK